MYTLVGSLLADAVVLGFGVLGIKLRDARGQDAGLLLWVDDPQLALILNERSRACIHLILQAIKLLYHKAAHAHGISHARFGQLIDIRVCYRISHVCCLLGIVRAVGDFEQQAAGRVRHGQIFKRDRTGRQFLLTGLILRQQVKLFSNRA